MEHVIKHDLYHAFLGIEKDINKKWPLMGNRMRQTSIPKRELVDKAWAVTDLLTAHPFFNAKTVSAQTGLTKGQLAVIYKMIQRSNACQEYFKTSRNRDYFNVVTHYFNHDFYTLVFFVGTSCPSRCLYCPSVKIDAIGRRRLVRYKNDESSKMSEESLRHVFDDLAAIRKKGTDILVKISGGLEPLTDTNTMERIIHLSRQLELPVKLFTNGLLLSDPDKRKVALKTGDIRISLSTADDNQYQAICFSHHARTAKPKALARLKDSIRQLIRERSTLNPDCRVGFNSIILPENHMHLVSLLEMARDLGIDYIDFKPDYFSVYDDKVLAAMDTSIREAKVVAAHESYRDLYVNFTGSLSRDDLFWNPWPGTCKALKQSDFKLFITPFGHCSPVHYGAFPHSESSFKGKLAQYSIGEITPEHGLLDVLNSPSRAPEIELKKLNPFELMLNLEITREDDDKEWGMPLSVSPFHTRQRDMIPADLLFPFNVCDRKGDAAGKHPKEAR